MTELRGLLGFIGACFLILLVAFLLTAPLMLALGVDVLSVLPELALIGGYTAVIAGAAVWALNRWLV